MCGRDPLLSWPRSINAPAFARASAVRWQGGSPFRKAQLTERRTQGRDRQAVALLIHLPGLELGLQLLQLRAELPLATASAAVQQYPTGEQVAALASGWQKVF